MKKSTLIISIILFSSTFFAQNFEWAKSFGGINGSGNGSSVASDNHGNIYTTGYFGATTNFNAPASYSLTSNGMDDVFITKHDSTGNLLWAKSFGGSNYDKGRSIHTDASGNVIITGSFHGIIDFDPNPNTTYNLNSTGLTDAFILKLDNNGNFIWAKCLGSLGDCVPSSITSDINKCIYLTGFFTENIDFDPGATSDTLKCLGGSDAFLLKLDSLGNYVWAKNVASSQGNETATDVGIDNSGNVYTIGNFNSTSDFNPGNFVSNLSSSGVTDVFISKLDNNGNFVWAKKLGGNSFDEGHSLVIDQNKNVYATGFFEGTADFNPHIITTYTLNAPYGLNSFISKLDSTGNFVWAKQITGSQANNIANAIALDPQGNIYTTGCYMNTTDFDPGIDSFYVDEGFNTNLNRAYILKLNSSGSFINVKIIGAMSSGCYGQAISVIEDDNIALTGYYNASGDFDPGTGTYYQTANGYQDAFIVKLGKSQVGIIERNNSNQSFYIYPNPNSGSFKILYNKEINLNLINAMGEVLQTQRLNSVNNYQASFENLSSGIYFISGQGKHQAVNTKIIVTN